MGNDWVGVFYLHKQVWVENTHRNLHCDLSSNFPFSRNSSKAQIISIQATGRKTLSVTPAKTGLGLKIPIKAISNSNSQAIHPFFGFLAKFTECESVSPDNFDM